jgi:diguanylate cyclase (GGDEF)-like protein
MKGSARKADEQPVSMFARLLAEQPEAGDENAAKELQTLRTALSEIADGILLLDRDMRLDFINRAACEFAGASMPGEGEKPTYAELIRGAHVATSGESLEQFITRRVETVVRGDPTPVDVNFLGGKVVRSRCVVLPNGGRLLTYTDITDIVRHHDELTSLHAALDHVEYGVVLLDHNLRARFVNRAFRKMSEMPDVMADAGPTFREILEHGRKRSAYALAESEVDGYIARRMQQVTGGEVQPIELRWSDGRVVRHQITALPGGSRMLTYTDITDLARTADQLEKLATTDSLTGLANRRQFISLAENEIGRFYRYGRPVSMLLIDIDMFKAVNDRFGHDVGDRMIEHIATLCEENKRAPDVVARVGGEEFAILLPETDMENSRAVAERLRRKVAAAPLNVSGIQVPATISVGVSEFNAPMNGVSDLMKLADRMLYAAKRAGRNRVVSPGDASRSFDVSELFAPLES